MKTWDIVTIRFPFPDGSGAKQRPAVVLSKAADLAEGEDALFMLITSNIERQAHNDVPILMAHPEFRWTGLAKDSCIRVDKIMHLRKSIVCRVLGNLGPQLIETVRTKLRQVLPL
jgi:mRNA-degrading endonuclease toxin of MazEF toxin-antitoxin module